MTNERDHRMVWAGQLADKIDKHLDGPYIYPHLHARLALLLHGEEIRFVQLEADQVRGFSISGDLRVWTDRQLAVTRFDNLVCLAPGVPPNDYEDHSAAQVSVQLIPRNALTAMGLPSSSPDGAAINGGSQWMSGLRDSDWSWPRGAALVLTYDGLEQPIVLPGTGDPAELEALIPSLLVDLAAR